MDAKTKILLERTFKFGVELLIMLRKLPNDFSTNVPKKQLARSCTSIGANYEEAQAAVSKKDFANKIGISLKEARESYYWIRVLIAISTEEQINDVLKRQLKEADELRNIFGAIKRSLDSE